MLQHSVQLLHITSVIVSKGRSELCLKRVDDVQPLCGTDMKPAHADGCREEDGRDTFPQKQLCSHEFWTFLSVFSQFEKRNI